MTGSVPRIAIDAMGGDSGPPVMIAGAALAYDRRDDLSFLLFGDKDAIGAELASRPRLAAVCEIVHCDDCDAPIHPPEILCPHCLSRSVRPRAAAGTGTIYSYTINHQPWMPGPELPYVVAIVEIVEQPSVRLTTNIVNIDPDAVKIGMPVRVTFEHHPDPEGDVWIPLFEPAR